MNQDTIQIFFSLLRSAICGNLLTEQERALYSDEMLPNLIAISKKHDISHLVAFGLDANGLLVDEIEGIGREIAKAVYRYTQINYGFEVLCNAFEDAKIDFMPLKGTILRQYYPEPWMRTSCDIDILVHENDLEKATEYLIKNLGYSFDKKGTHDVSLFLGDRLHLELHYTLIGDGVAKSSCEVLRNVWHTASLCQEKAHCYKMTEEMFYFYHIAHMAKHFEEGGCGIRPFIDLWILDHIENKDQSKRDALLEQGELLRFSEVARHLSRVWFGNEEHSELTKQMEQYILRGGVYGNSENRILVQQQKKGGKIKYVFSKVFLPYEVIKFHYPILQKHRWLTPFMQVRRWFKLVFCGHAQRTMDELKYNQSISSARAEATKEFLFNIGL